MDEEKVREKHSNTFSKPQLQPVILPPEASPGYLSSPDHGGSETFLSPDSSSGRKKIEYIDVSTNVEVPTNVDVPTNAVVPTHVDVPTNVVVPTNVNVSKHVDVLRNAVVSKNVDKDGSNSKQLEKDDSQVGHIDTAAPFESVKEAVSKFGGIVDWKAHRVQTNERRKYIEQELEKAQEEIPVYKQKAEAAEQAKEQALRDLDSTKRLIEELKLNLERAKTEEHQAKQDSELAQLRVQEMEQGNIAGESSIAAKTQLELAKARHQAAVSELVTAKTDLEETRKDYEVLISERDSALQKAQEAVSAAKEIEREVEDLTIQLITTKESIESMHASHLEAEEIQIQEANERDQEAINLDHELKETENELEKVKQQIVVAKDLKSKLETASGLLQNLKDELAVYMQGKVPDESEEERFTRKDIQSGVAIAKKNLDEVNNNIEKTTEAIMCLKTAAKSLTAKLESEKQVLTNVRKQKGLGAEAVVNLESELKRTRIELDNIRKKEKEAREKLVELPKQLQKVSEETENAKSLAEGARLVLKRAKDAAEQAKSGVNSISSQIAATEKEIEAARAKEKLALGAINALQESESARGQKDDPKGGGVTISLEEYYEISKRAHEAEEAANKRVEDAMAKIDEAKDSEMQSLNKLTQLNSEIAARKQALNVALQKAEIAKESTLNFEEELKKRKGENGESKKGEGRGGLFHGLSQKGSRDSSNNTGGSDNLKSNTKGGGPEGNSNNAGDTSPDAKSSLKKKKRLIMPSLTLMMPFKGKKKPFFHKNS